MTRANRPRTRGPGRRRYRARLVLSVLAALAVIVTAACSDAPTEREIKAADDGVDPSIIPIFTSEALLSTVQALGTVFLIDHPGVTFQYTAMDADTVASRVGDGVRPSLWIDRADVIASLAGGPDAKGAPAPVGDDPMEFVVYKDFKGTRPTLEAFGAGTFPARAGLCETTAPCGSAGDEILEQAGIEPDPDVLVPTGRELVNAFAQGKVDTALLYRSDAARLWTAFKLLPLPDPTIGALTYESLRLRDDAVGEAFQSWIATSPDAAAILIKLGLRPRPGVPVP
jgi:hypothetical protein